ncbi:uncharacterized protein LOC128764175 [Synchiropus splendidus]|uniref:uncharacterized protein LOC128764175 n=1 Tax=Synchiropus splendidus TaxID=270530 RepID=UPI00237DEC9A|nr:uncharacterized protein LOC128764175 [Synchiropus splendidus]
MLLLLLVTLLLPGVGGGDAPVFAYSKMGDDVALQCGNWASSSGNPVVTWTFYHGSMSFPTLEIDSSRQGDGYERRFITWNCSLVIRSLGPEDIGTYKCMLLHETFAEVFLSVLVVSSPTPATDLRPGRPLSLSCTLFTYYDGVSCSPHSKDFNVSWTSEDGTNLLQDRRFEVKVTSRCNITLVKQLQSDDFDRRWRCQVTFARRATSLSLDFYPSFVFHNRTTFSQPDCAVPLPISRILLCALLPAMVLAVCVWTWRLDRQKTRAPPVQFDFP